MIKQFKKVFVKTDHPHPVNSPDYTDPAGSIEDNNTNSYFIYEIDSTLNGRPYKLLDIGCAGGQFAVDIYNKGFPWLGVGIEGGNILGMTKEFDSRNFETGLLTSARGAENWKQYKDKCLFHADVSKPFEVVDEKDEIIKFDLITAYEFFEHPLPEEIPHILENLKKHLSLGGIIVGTINLSPGEHHRCAKSINWWIKMFDECDLVATPYPFKSSPRTGLNYIIYVDSFLSNPKNSLATMSLDEEASGSPSLGYPNIAFDADGNKVDLKDKFSHNFPFCCIRKDDYHKLTRIEK